MASHLALSLSLAAIFCSFVHGLPIADTVNTTISRMRLKRSMRFPTDPRRHADISMIQPANVSRATPGDEPFVFPDDLPSIRPRFVPKITKRSPKCAKESTYCEKIEDYPEEYLETMINSIIEDYQPFLGTDIVKEPAIGHRIDAVDESQLCPSIEEVVYPETAKNEKGDWLYVVNKEPFKQGVRVEKCLQTSSNSEQKCAFTEQFPLGYKTSCKQKFIYRKLLALDAEGKPYPDHFMLPSCCSCTVVQENLRPRLGNRHPTSPIPVLTPKDEA